MNITSNIKGVGEKRWRCCCLQLFTYLTFNKSFAVAKSSAWTESSNVIVTNWGTSFGWRPLGGVREGQRQLGSLQVVGSQGAAVVAAKADWAAKSATTAVLILNTFIFLLVCIIWNKKKRRKER